MQALSMIDGSANTLDMLAPARPAERHDPGFDRALRERQQPEKQTAAVEPAQRKKAPEGKSDVAGDRQDERGGKTVPEKAERSQTVSDSQSAKSRKAEIPQTIVNLLQKLAKGDSLESGEESETIEGMLEDLLQQLEGAELQGEEKLAGIDLSALVEQLQAISQSENGEEQLAQLISDLEQQLDVELNEQLVIDSGMEDSAELTASLAQSSLQAQERAAEPLDKGLAQARQILQRAIDTVTQERTVTGQSTEAVVAEGNDAEQFLAEDSGEPVDPRFAELLKPRSEALPKVEGLRERFYEKATQQQPVQAGQGEQQAKTLGHEKTEAKLAEILTAEPKPGADHLLHQMQGQQPFSQQQPMVNGKMAQQVPMVQLPSGQQVAESQIFDQVVTHVSGSMNGESGRMVLRLQPAELGSLKLELTVEGDRVRANLQAQTQQVQEVLERHLPQLRNALAEQGLKIDQFQVDVDSRQGQQGQFDNLAQQHQQRGSQGGQAPVRWGQPWQSEEQSIPLTHLMQNGGGGISLHV